MFGPGCLATGAAEGGDSAEDRETGEAQSRWNSEASAIHTTSQLALRRALGPGKLGIIQLSLRVADSWREPDQLYIGATW